jgi:hypothetical protein
VVAVYLYHPEDFYCRSGTIGFPPKL